ncbi:hypothetical protein ABT093_16240 [Kitasatospora sp. NPDC002551]|uniref:hypothetical protein n=1 Tax=Kitasatospora sp. NPDC002551 TaxID=3154539 RepID=UPI00332A2EC6
MSDTDPTLPTPVVEEADGVILTPIDGQDVTVTIAPYPNMEAGDQIQLFWNGRSAPVQHQVTDAQDGEPINITIPLSTIQAAGDGTFYLRYTIQDQAGNTSRSAPTQITIEQP